MNDLVWMRDWGFGSSVDGEGGGGDGGGLVVISSVSRLMQD